MLLCSLNLFIPIIFSSFFQLRFQFFQQSITGHWIIFKLDCSAFSIDINIFETWRGQRPLLSLPYLFELAFLCNSAYNGAHRYQLSTKNIKESDILSSNPCFAVTSGVTLDSISHSSCLCITGIFIAHVRFWFCYICMCINMCLWVYMCVCVRLMCKWILYVCIVYI